MRLIVVVVGLDWCCDRELSVLRMAAYETLPYNSNDLTTCWTYFMSGFRCEFPVSGGSDACVSLPNIDLGHQNHIF